MNKILVFAVLSLWSVVTSAGLSNQLQDHASPYLAMHSDDPVKWQAWGPEVLAQAKKENKLIFVSIGYFACHWCHVMQRESYADETVASYLNSSYIPVKIDRELNPALDAYLIEFVQRTRGQAGWPLNVFVTPDGNPVVGITYLPKLQFISLLMQLTGLWKKDSAYMVSMAAQAAAIQKNEKVQVTHNLNAGFGRQYQAKFMQEAMSYGDDMAGGFGDTRKFPMIAQLRGLITAYDARPFAPIKQFVELTLNQMSSQGLRDHIGGGFYRYTVDPTWQTPHFEKMLYTNASMVLLYLKAAKSFKREEYNDIARETLDFMLRELITESGGMVASFSAVDDKGMEGGYYLWQQETVKKILSDEEFELVYLLWNMTDAPAHEAGYLPLQAISPDDVAKKLGVSKKQIMATRSSAYQKLYRARKARKLPVDTKLLTAWNGLALEALSAGARLDNGGKYLASAKKVRDYLVLKLWDGHRLYRARGKYGSIGKAGLEDYAYAASGLLEYAQVSGAKDDLKLVRQWLDIAWRRFYSSTGWQLSDEMLLPYQMGVAIIDDNPMPSPSSSLIRTSFRLGRMTNDEKLNQLVLGALEIGHGLLKEQAFSYASQIELLTAYQGDAKLSKVPAVEK